MAQLPWIAAFGFGVLFGKETDGWQWLVLFDETITKTVMHGLHERLIQWLKRCVKKKTQHSRIRIT